MENSHISIISDFVVPGERQLPKESVFQNFNRRKILGSIDENCTFLEFESFQILKVVEGISNARECDVFQLTKIGAVHEFGLFQISRFLMN